MRPKEPSPREPRKSRDDQVPEEPRTPREPRHGGHKIKVFPTRVTTESGVTGEEEAQRDPKELWSSRKPCEQTDGRRADDVSGSEEEKDVTSYTEETECESLLQVLMKSANNQARSENKPITPKERARPLDQGLSETCTLHAIANATVESLTNKTK